MYDFFSILFVFNISYLTFSMMLLWTSFPLNFLNNDLAHYYHFLKEIMYLIAIGWLTA